jgi:glycosyltransferase involved in cell wall biosynthesis
MDQSNSTASDPDKSGANQPPAAKPALESLDAKLRHHIEHEREHIHFDKEMIIGIDGNEANVENRVGSNTYAYQLLKALHQHESHHKYIIYLKNPPMDDMPPANDFWEYRVIPMAHFWSQLRLPWEIKTSQPKPHVFFNPGHYISPFIPVPVVIAIMDLAYIEYPQMFNGTDAVKLKVWTQQSINKANHIMAISQHTKNEIIKHYSYPKRDITVTHLGIDHQQYQFPQLDNDINRVKETYGITKDYILYVGTLQPRKNLLRLIEAFKNLNQDNYQLVIAGKKGWLYEEILQKAEELEIKGHVVFTDFVPEPDLPPLMAGARCLALVSLYEGFGIPVIEAMAVGTPAVVSKTSSLHEIIGHGGFTVDPENVDSIANGLKKIVELSHDDYIKLVDNGLEHAHLFRWEHVAKQTLKVLETVGIWEIDK